MTQPISTLKNWVLLRGLAREQKHWGEFITLCHQYLPDYQFHCLDLPGCGENNHLQSPLSISAIRTTLQKQLQSKQITGPFGIIGLSLGAMVALDWLAEKETQAEAAVIINTSTNDFPFYWRFRWTIIWPALRALLSTSIEQRERLILQLASRQHTYNKSIASNWLAIQQQHPVTRSTILRQLIAAIRFSAPVFSSPKQGLILCSDNDTMVSHQCSLQLAKQYQWPLQHHTDAGHDLPMDDPLWVIEQFKGWLQDTNSSSVN